MVIRVFPETKEQINFLAEWESTSSVDFWSRSSTIERFTDLRVNPESYV
jgi:carboxypeptidase A2